MLPMLLSRANSRAASAKTEEFSYEASYDPSTDGWNRRPALLRDT